MEGCNECIQLKKDDSFAFGFFLTAIAFFVLFFIGCIVSSVFYNEYFFIGSPLFFQDYSDVFMDFFNVNAFVEDMDPYVGCGSSYPPLVLLIAKLFNFISYYGAGGRFARSTFAGVIAILIFWISFFVPAYFLTKKVFLRNGKSVFSAKLMFFACLATAPFLYAFLRGNYIFYALLFSVIFFVYYKDENQIVRELAYVSLAVSVGIKLYPAVFALILIKDRNWGAFFRVVLYCICLVVLPFFAFEGGFLINLKYFIINLNIFSTQPYRFSYNGAIFTNFYSYGVSIQNFVRMIYCKFTNTSMLDVGADINFIGLVFTFLFVLMLVFSAMITKSKWKHVCAMALLQSLFPDPSYVYSMIFLFIPMIMFVLDKEKKTGKDVLYMLLFALMLSPVQFGYFIDTFSLGLQYGFSWSNFAEVVFMLVMTVVLFADSVKGLLYKPVVETVKADKILLTAKYIKNVVCSAINGFVSKISAVLSSYKEKRASETSEKKEGRIYKYAAIINMCLAAILVVVGIFVCGKIYGSLEAAFDYFYSFGISDFGQVIYFAMKKNPYIGDFTTSYTPINFLFFKLFALICSANDAFYIPLTFEDLISYNKAILMTPQFWGTFIPYVLLCLVAMYFILRGMSGMSKKNFLFFFIAVSFSNFMIYGISRGSNILLVFTFVALFLRFKESENNVLREISYIALAVAGAMKIYPFFFGIYIVRQRKWKDCLRIALYGILLIVFPFAFIDGGFTNIPLYLQNFFVFTGEEGRITGATNISAPSVFAKLIALIFDGRAETVLTSVFKWLSSVSIFVVSVIFGLKAKNDFSLSIIVMCAITLIPSVSYFYLIIFAIVPIMEFIKCRKNMSKARKYYYTAFFLFNGFIALAAFSDYTVIAVLYMVTLVFETVNIKKESKEKDVKIY